MLSWPLGVEEDFRGSSGVRRRIMTTALTPDDMTDHNTPTRSISPLPRSILTTDTVNDPSVSCAASFGGQGSMNDNPLAEQRRDILMRIAHAGLRFTSMKSADGDEAFILLTVCEPTQTSILIHTREMSTTNCHERACDVG